MTPEDVLKRHVGHIVGFQADPEHVPFDWEGAALRTGEDLVVRHVEETDRKRTEDRFTARIAQAAYDATRRDTRGRIEEEPPLAEPQALPEPILEQDIAEAQMYEKSLDSSPQAPSAEDIAYQESLSETPQEPMEAEESPEVPLVSEDTYRAFATVEGDRDSVYKDSQGLKTVGVGFNMDQEGAKELWEQAGVDQDFDQVYGGTAKLTKQNKQRLLKHNIGMSEDKARTRAEQLGLDWDLMPEWHKAIVTDVAFNTGDVSGWTKVFTNKHPLAVLREARRTEGKKNTKGMDNRVARIGLSLGIISSVEQARRIGLKLADLPKHEVAALRKEYEDTQLARAEREVGNAS